MKRKKSHNGIGTLRESSLHAALKERLKQPGDRCEVDVDGFKIDLVRQDDTLVEIQTGNFSRIHRKLGHLLEEHPIRLVYPISENKWIVRTSEKGELLQRRKSPKHGMWFDVFSELVYIPDWIIHPNFQLTLLKIEEDEIWRDDGQGSWRRRYWSKADRRLLNILEGYTLEEPGDYLQLLPEDLAEPFTTRDLGTACGCRIRLAQQIAYTLFHAGLLKRAGFRGRSHLYQKS
ncbi:MAG: hypothetical protein JXA25_19760 [Anaerolineales bacterium]|nr:hypothetical protein [Anaerolineales bacterium]